MDATRSSLIELCEKIERLAQFQDRIEPPSDPARIWGGFLEDARALVAVEGSALFLVEETSQDFVLDRAEPETLREAFQREIDLQIEVGVFPVVLRRRQPSITPSLGFGPAWSIVLLPLATGRRTLGMAALLTPLPESALTLENMRLLGVLARQCSLVMENAVLYERLRREKESLEEATRRIHYLSQRDPLTGCFNRGYMNEQLPREIRRAARYRRALAVALCDLDHFKGINDARGHLCGDRVLREFVAATLELIRSDSDWMARYGGEEFLLVLPETSLENAIRLAERLRSQIAAKAFSCEGESFGVTASFGVVGLDAGAVPKGLSAEALLQQADGYLYRAKKRGRNRVVGGPPAL
ncbi:MAG: sensor domain-containing diguanylate cyclase [Desulfobacterales bacterium]